MRLGIELGIPVLGAVATSGADVGEGVASLHAWGRVARALADASGVVPTCSPSSDRASRVPRSCSAWPTTS